MRCHHPLYYAISPLDRFLYSLEGEHKPSKLSIIIDFGTYDLSHCAKLGDVNWLLVTAAKMIRREVSGLCLLKLTAVYMAGEPSSVHSIEVILDCDNLSESFAVVREDLKERGRMPGVNAEQLERLRHALGGWWNHEDALPGKLESVSVVMKLC